MPDCYHLVLRGKIRETRGFIKGLIVGADAFGSVYFMDDLNVEDEGLFGWLKGMIHPEDNLLSLLVDSNLLKLIDRGVHDLAQDLNMEIVASKKVKQASFKFTFECFSKEHGELIHKLFEELPEGVETDSSTTFKTTVDPDAEGVELYSPAHDYEYRGKGRLSGQVRKVLDIYQKAMDEPLVDLGKIEFEFE